MKLSRRSLIFIITIVVTYKIYCWGAILNITPDSASYISTTKHFVAKGKFINLTNWPSMTLLPIDEPFTDCAPGLPLFLSLFMKIIGEPLVSAFVLQSIFLVFFFFFLYKLFEILKINSLTLLSAILIVALFPMTSKVLYSFFAELPLAITILACMFYSIRLNISENIENNIWYIALALFLGSCFKYIGVFTVVPALTYLVINNRLNKSKKFSYGLLYLISGTLPVVLWFIRNHLLYGYTTYSHKVGHKIDFGVFDSFLHKLSFINHFLPIIAVTFFITFIVLTLLPLIHKKFSEIKTMYLGLYLAFIVNFGGIVFLSMISDFNELGPRLLFPSLLCLIVCIIYVLDYSFKTKLNNFIFVLASLLTILFVYKETKMFGQPFINLPIEKKISNIIINEKANFNSTHYYSEFDNYLMQLYLNQPIRFLNKINFKNSDTNSYLKLRELGQYPFFVFSDTSSRNIEIEPLVNSGKIERIHLTEFKTSIYKFRN